MFHFWNLHQILNILKKGIIVTANVFPKLETVKILVRPLSKKISFRTQFNNQHVKASQIFAKSSWGRFCRVFSSFLGKLICKMSPLVLGEALVFFLTEWLPMASILFKIVRICSSQFKCYYLKKRKSFSQSFVLFLETITYFEDFEKNDDCHS